MKIIEAHIRFPIMNEHAFESETSIFKKHSLVFFFILSYAIMTIMVLLKVYFDVPDFFYLTFAVWSPTISAAIMSGIIGGWQEIKMTFRGLLIWRFHPKWYFGAFFLLIGPLIFAIIYIILGFESPGINPLLTPISFVLGLLNTLYLGPLSEETGWRGFALPKLQQKYNALTSSIILGILWACWHLPLYLVEERMPFYIYLPLVIVLTILFTWLYNNTGGSIIIAIIAHFCFNFDATWIAGELGLLPQMVFYIAGSIMILPYVIIVVWYFGPSKLSRKPDSELPFTRES